MSNPSLKNCWRGLRLSLAVLILTSLGAIIFPSNASAQSETRIISVNTNLDFGNTEIHSIKEFILVIANKGNSDLTISGIDFPDGFEAFYDGVGFLTEVTNTVIPAGGRTNFFVMFTPTNVMHYSGTVTITSDATRGKGTFAISGEGVYPTGRYVGLFSPDQGPGGSEVFPPGTNGTFDNSGYFSGNVAANGGFTGTLLLAGVRHPFSGRLSSSGDFSGTLPQAGGNDLGVSFQVSAAWEGVISNQSWAANLVAYRASTDPLSPIITFDGLPPDKYHFRIAGSTNSLLAPTNDGAGTLRITASRSAHLRGTLGDGAAFSQSTVFPGRNEVPLYALLYQRRGALMGWVSCVIQPTNVVFPIPDTNGPHIPPILISNLPPYTNLPPLRTNFPPGTNIVVIPSGPQAAPSSTIIMTDERRGDPVLRTFRGTNWIHGSIKWIKPAQIDSNYPDGFSINTTVNGPTD